MTPYTFTESEVEEAALAWFAGLGYTVLSGPEIAPGEVGEERTDYHQPFLLGRVRDALRRINPALPGSTVDEAVRKLTVPSSASLIENNHTFHRYLTDGIPVEYRENGAIRHGLAKVIDLEDPGRNDLVVVNQYTIKEGDHTRRPDIVVFANGIPVGVIELKNPADENATIWSAYNQLQTYKQQIPSLFYTNEVLIVSDGVQARVGSLTADEDRFMHWRTIDGDETAPGSVPELEVLLKGLFQKERFLEYLTDYILFENDGKTFIKKLPPTTSSMPSGQRWRAPLRPPPPKETGKAVSSGIRRAPERASPWSFTRERSSSRPGWRTRPSSSSPTRTTSTASSSTPLHGAASISGRPRSRPKAAYTSANCSSGSPAA
jgi:Type I site-specific restriction-modification system, R (restriction) subunit and related helicases